MREILFRGKRIDNGEWVEGYLFDDGMVDLARRFVGQIIIEDCDEYLDVTGTYFYEIAPETVCQYTGLTDGNGRKIFEGDIISGEIYHDWGKGGECVPEKIVIKWNEKRAAFEPVYWWELYNYDLKYHEVIGNIFDNPDLVN